MKSFSTQNGSGPVAIPLLSFLTVFVTTLVASSILTPSYDKTGAASVNVGATVAPAIELEAPTEYELTPTVGSATATVATKPVTVSTNDPLGYRLYATLGPDLTCLRHTVAIATTDDCAGVDTALKIPLSTTATTTLPWNNWGLSVDGGSNWLQFGEVIVEQDYDSMATSLLCEAVVASEGVSMDACRQELIEAGLGSLRQASESIADSYGEDISSIIDSPSSLFAWYAPMVSQYIVDVCDNNGEFFQDIDYCSEFVPYTASSAIAKYGNPDAGASQQALLKYKNINAVNDITQLSVGTRIDMSIKAGTYRGQMQITAVAEPLPEPVIASWESVDNYNVSEDFKAYCGTIYDYGPGVWSAQNCQVLYGLNLTSLASMLGTSRDNPPVVATEACSLMRGTLTIVDDTVAVCDYDSSSAGCDVDGWTSIWGTVRDPMLNPVGCP